MWGFLLYFFAGSIASLYVLLRSGFPSPACRRSEAVILLLLLLLGWPLILSAPYWYPLISRRRER